MATTLILDPSRPCQISGGLLALWLPRGRGRDALASGLVVAVRLCPSPECLCTNATLDAVEIDDRAEKVTLEEGRIIATWRRELAETPRPERTAALKLDIRTGAVVSAESEKLPDVAAPFFDEPLPYWVLDHICERWAALRQSPSIDWKAQALNLWQPGDLLSTMVAFPEARADCYRVDDKVYQVDTLFCIKPECDCDDNLFRVFEYSEDLKHAREVGSAWLPTKTMVPSGFDGDEQSLKTFIDIYMEWRRRNVPPQERLLELRSMTRRRGLELHRLATQKQKQKRVAVSSSSRPGRNAPCPCGSGRKYKRCCGK